VTLAVIKPGNLPGAVDGRRQLVPLEQAFAGTSLRNAPIEYWDVVQLICVIASPTTLAERSPETLSARQDLAASLFNLLGCAHRRLHLAMTRGAGSSIDEITVSPGGRLLDLYFLVGPGDVPGAELSNGQRQDIAAALKLIIHPFGQPDLIRKVLAQALCAYWRRSSLSPDVIAIVDRVAADAGAPTPEAISDLTAAALSGFA
jgi:hypothetical protein